MSRKRDPHVRSDRSVAGAAAASAARAASAGNVADQPRDAGYAARVPAVARAVAALQHLAAAQQPVGLSGLSRALDVSPSSLLAILTTLRGAGLVSRSGRDGRYLPGPSLVALGNAAAQRLEPLAAFDLLAADLVDRLGETVLLWVQQGDGLALATAREGSQPLRYVPPLGLRLPLSWSSFELGAPSGVAALAHRTPDAIAFAQPEHASAASRPRRDDEQAPAGSRPRRDDDDQASAGFHAQHDDQGSAGSRPRQDVGQASAGLHAQHKEDQGSAGSRPRRGDDDHNQACGGLALTEGELEPGVWMLLAPFDDGALLGLAGPQQRLRGAAGASARAVLRATLGTDGIGSPRSIAEGAGPIGASELDAFLGQALVASLSYLSADGYPASVPLWYDWDGAAFWLVPSPGAEWAEHVRRNPRVSLAVSESTPPLRRVLARGPMLAVDDADGMLWRGVEARLAVRYARLEPGRLLAARGLQGRVLLRLEPERLIAWRGLLRPAA